MQVKMRDCDLNKMLSGIKECLRLSMRALFILADTCLPGILLDRDNSVDRIIKVKLVYSKWRDINHVLVFLVCVSDLINVVYSNLFTY